MTTQISTLFLFDTQQIHSCSPNQNCIFKGLKPKYIKCGRCIFPIILIGLFDFYYSDFHSYHESLFTIEGWHSYHCSNKALSYLNQIIYYKLKFTG